MDNFHIDITAEGEESLKKALEIAFAHNAPGSKATHYSVRKLERKTTYYANPPTKTLHGGKAMKLIKWLCCFGWHKLNRSKRGYVNCYWCERCERYVEDL